MRTGMFAVAWCVAWLALTAQTAATSAAGAASVATVMNVRGDATISAPAGGATLESGCGPQGSALGEPLHTVVATFLAQVRSDAELRSDLEAALAQSQTHGPNSTLPWTVCDVLACFNEGVFYVGIGAGETPIFLLDDILRGDVWSNNVAAKAFVHDYVVAKGAYYHSESTAAAITAILKLNSVDLQDYEVPLGGYKSLGAFFTRKIVPSRRPIDSTHNYVSPVDCIVSNVLDNVGGLHGNESVPVKGHEQVNMSALLGSTELAKPFVGGRGLFVGLGEGNYHRWHAPCDCNVTRVDLLGDMYYGMYGNCYNNFYCLNWGYKYHRAAIYLKDRTTGLRSVVVPIGMGDVGSVVPFVAQGDAVSKGDPLGMFDFGGSGVFVAFEDGHPVQLADGVGVGKAIKMGQALAHQG